MRRLVLRLVIGLVVLAGLYLAMDYAYRNRLYAPVSHLIPKDAKAWLKDTVLVFQRKRQLEEELAGRDRRIALLEDATEVLDEHIRQDPGLLDALPFTRTGDATYPVLGYTFRLVRYETPLVPLDFFGRRAYLALHGDDLIVVTGKAMIARIPLADIADGHFTMTALPGNLGTLADYPEFREVSEFSVKDTLVIGDRLLVSYTKATRPDCYTLAIAAADLAAAGPLDFADIWVPGECVGEDEDWGAPIGNQTGGRMLDLGNGHILVSTGEWDHMTLAQDPGSVFGKVLDLDPATGATTLVSMGHRNPQGLYRDPAANIVVVTEHGAEGGDEVNINRSPGGEAENYGWPMASYGEHYTRTDELYARAPLKKSHADNGFIEPDRYFVPSLSPSQVVRLPDPADPARYSLLMGTMGSNYIEGDESLHVFDLDKDFRITAQDRVAIDARVRDLIDTPTPGTFLMWLEGQPDEFGALGVLMLEPAR
jgi:hypothetical protein